MKQKNYAAKLQNAPRNVFSASDLRTLWGINENWFGTVAKRLVDNGTLTRISRGYYLFGNTLNPFELANIISVPSYVSLNSALRYFDINFQESSVIHSAAGASYRKDIAGYTFVYHKIKDEILLTSDGVKTDNGVTVAVPERAILDSMYLGTPINVDRPEKINKNRLVQLSRLYPKSVQKQAKNF